MHESAVRSYAHTYAALQINLNVVNIHFEKLDNTQKHIITHTQIVYIIAQLLILN